MQCQSTSLVDVHSNRYQVAKLLLDEGSDVNARSCTDNTPVHVATVWGHSRLLALYLSHPKCLVDPQVHVYYTAGVCIYLLALVDAISPTYRMILAVPLSAYLPSATE
jgi:ankyrin repeat protein